MKLKEQQRILMCDANARKKLGITHVPLGPVRGNFAVQLSSFLLATPKEESGQKRETI